MDNTNAYITIKDRKWRAPNVVYQFTAEELSEFSKCSNDLLYFIENYCKIKHEDSMIKNINLRDYQKEIIKNLSDFRFNILAVAPQMGSTLILSCVILHEIIFRNNWTTMIMGNNKISSIEILEKVKNLLINLPYFLSPGVIQINENSIRLDTDSRLLLSNLSREPAIGFTINSMYILDMSKIPYNIINIFYLNLLPNICALKNSKLNLIGYSNPGSLFNKIFLNSKLPDFHPDKNMYNNIIIKWNQIQNRDENWKLHEIKMRHISYEEFEERYEQKELDLIYPYNAEKLKKH